MKVRMLPDWFGLIFIWGITIMIVAAAITEPYRSLVNRRMFWFLPLLAVAWTAGFVALQRLKNKYKEEYETLGNPQLFGAPHEARTWRFLFYVFSFGFRRLSDRLITVGFSVLVIFTLLAGLMILSAFLVA